MEAGGTAAGWYPDPHGSERQRYWDGAQWTEHYHGGQGEATAETAVAPAAGVAQYQHQPHELSAAADPAVRPRFYSLRIIATILRILAFLVAVLGTIGVVVSVTQNHSLSTAAKIGAGVGGLVAVAFYAVLIFAGAAMILLWLAIEENTRAGAEASAALLARDEQR